MKKLLWLVVLVGAAFAQAAGRGAVSVSVLGPDGLAVPGATVTLVSTSGPVQALASAAGGTFVWQDLASGTYTLQVRAIGFAAQEDAGVIVAVGRTAQRVVRLHVATEAQSVSVSSAPLSFDPGQTSSVVNIDRDRVEELPIPSRNYLSFVLLSPQVAPANPALAQPGVSQGTPSFSFGGLRPGSNAIYLDGVNDNDEYSGSSRTQLSPEAISDFQIVNHGFAAESGGGAGGSIDVQTRMGTNKLHGDAFTFIQNGALNGTPPLELATVKPSENRLRLGVSLGGALKRDRTFFYIAAEQELAHGQESSDLQPATLSAIQSALQGYAPLAGQTYSSGFFPTTDQETELSGRVDRRLTARHSVMARYAFSNSRNVSDAYNTDEFADRSARGSSFVSDNSLSGMVTSTLSSTLLNRVGLELAQRRAVGRTNQAAGPGILVPGVALLGTPFAGNDRRFETHVELSDTATMQTGRHLLQAGVRGDHVALRAHTPEGAQGFFAFDSLAALAAGHADFYAQSFGSDDTNFSELRFSAFAQDHWKPVGPLTIDYGMRYEFNHLPGPLPQDAVNFAPRLGVAWTPWKTGVVRAGFGVFYDRYPLATIDRLLRLDGVHGLTQVVEDSAAAAVFRSGRVPAQPLPGVAPSVWQAQAGLRNPYSEVASLSVEQQLPLETTLTAEYQSVQGARLGRSSNVNLAPPVLLTLANAAALGVSAPTAQQLGRPVFGGARLNPAYDAVNQFESSAHSSYNGATVTLNRQFQDDLQVLVGYTFSKTIDDASSDIEQPQNPYAPRDERGLSLQDQRHRLTLSGLWLIGPDLGDPADAAKNANPGPLMKVLNGLEFAPIVSVASGFRANATTGLDSTREHIFPFATRPLGTGRNALATTAEVNLDLRVLKMIPVAGGHLDVVAESFNLLNHRNVALLNTVFGSAATPGRNFASPIAAQPARKLQFSLDYEF